MDTGIGGGVTINTSVIFKTSQLLGLQDINNGIKAAVSDRNGAHAGGNCRDERAQSAPEGGRGLSRCIFQNAARPDGLFVFINRFVFITIHPNSTPLNLLIHLVPLSLSLSLWILLFHPFTEEMCLFFSPAYVCGYLTLVGCKPYTLLFNYNK